MTDDILKPISQRSNNTETAENRKIHEIADELRRGCELYEAQFRNSQNNVRRFDIEQRVAEKYAKEHGIWLPMSNVFELGEKQANLLMKYHNDKQHKLIIK